MAYAGTEEEKPHIVSTDPAHVLSAQLEVLWGPHKHVGQEDHGSQTHQVLKGLKIFFSKNHRTLNRCKRSDTRGSWFQFAPLLMFES